MSLESIKVAILVEDMYEDLELWYPFYRLREEKADVSLVGPQAGKIYTSKHGYRLSGVCLAAVMLITVSLDAESASTKETKLPDQTYMPVVIETSFASTMAKDKAAKPEVMDRQRRLLEKRYDLRDDSSDVSMSAGRKPVQQGVRVRLPEAMTWRKLATMTPEEIKQKGLFPEGFRPLPHAHHATGGQVFPEDQIGAMADLEQRDLRRFDVDFDLPDHLTPQFPPPIFLTTRPDLGDVSQGKVLSIKNYYQLLKGKLTPVQMEGLRLLLTPFPQQQFNQTEDRKVADPSLGVTCLDCHVIRSAPKIRSKASTSMPLSGSSISTSFGCIARIDANSMRFRSPPESVLSTARSRYTSGFMPT